MGTTEQGICLKNHPLTHLHPSVSPPSQRRSRATHLTYRRHAVTASTHERPRGLKARPSATALGPTGGVARRAICPRGHQEAKVASLKPPSPCKILEAKQLKPEREDTEANEQHVEVNRFESQSKISSAESSLKCRLQIRMTARASPTPVRCRSEPAWCRSEPARPVGCFGTQCLRNTERKSC